MITSEKIRILFNYIITLLVFVLVFLSFSSITENKYIIILIVYILIGVLRAKVLFLQPRYNQPIVVRERQWGNLLLFGIILWLPMLILSIFNNGIKLIWKVEVDAIKNAFNKS